MTLAREAMEVLIENLKKDHLCTHEYDEGECTVCYHCYYALRGEQSSLRWIIANLRVIARRRDYAPLIK